MASRVGFLPSMIITSLISLPPLKNHQNWLIHREPDFSKGSPLLTVTDPYGINHEIQDFILGNPEPDFESALAAMTAREDKERLTCEYLRHRCANATAFQAHIETLYDEETNKPYYCLRLGDHGLKGGGRIPGLAGSAAEISMGVLCIFFSRKLALHRLFERISSAVCFSMGAASASYVLRLKPTEEFKWEDWRRHNKVGAFSGLVSGVFANLSHGSGTVTGLVKGKVGVEWLTQGAGAATRVVVQAVGNMAASIASSNYNDWLTGKTTDKEEMKKKALASGVGAFVSALIGEAFNGLSSSNDLLEAVGLQGLKGFVSSIVGKKAAQYYEGTELSWQDFVEALVFGGGLSALIAFLDHKENFNELKKLNEEKTQEEKKLTAAQKEHAAQELKVKNLSAHLKLAQDELADWKYLLKVMEQAQATFLQEQIEAAKQEIATANEKIDKGRESLEIAKGAKEIIARQLPTIANKVQNLQKMGEEMVRQLDAKLHAILKKGVKVKINGLIVNEPVEIREALLNFNGARIEWTGKGGVSEFRRIVDRLIETRHPLGVRYGRTFHNVAQDLRTLMQLENQLGEFQTELGEVRQIFGHFEELPHDALATSANPTNAGTSDLSTPTEFQTARNQLFQQISDLTHQISEIEVQQSATQSRVTAGIQEIKNLESQIETHGAEIQGVQETYLESFQANNTSWLPKIKPVYEAKAVAKAYKPRPVLSIPPEEALKELIDHVVLVQGIAPEAFCHCPELGESGYARATSNTPEADIFKAIYGLKGVLNPQGVVGHHLEFTKREFREKLEDRPHTHWAWNQLVQPNSGGDWEKAGVAMLEPLSQVENSIHHKPVGIAPYDTLILGPHRLSPKSKLLIPMSIETEAREHLKGFQGEIITYDWSKATLREAVINAIEKHYPQTWQVCDQQGSPIGKTSTYSAGGYNSKNYLRNKNEEFFLLMENGGSNPKDQLAPELKHYRDVSRRLLCLHSHAPTAALEDQTKSVEIEPGKKVSIPTYFGWLSRFTVGSKQDFNKNPLFAGGVAKKPEALKGLGILKMLGIYVAMQNYDPATGATEWGHYYLSEAMRADLISLLKPDEDSHLSHLQCVTIFNSTDDLIEALQKFDKALNSRGPDGVQQALEAFGDYCSLLKDRLVAVRQSTQQAADFLKQDEQNSTADASLQHPCLAFGQQEWNQVEVPENGEITIDKNWPRTEAHYAYVYKLVRMLPKQPEELKELHSKLFKVRREDKKEQYRVNLICSVIYGMVLNQYYLQLRPTEVHSIIANRILKETQWISKHFLKVEDFSNKHSVGDCLFDNVAGQLPEGVSASQDLRKKVVHHMKDHSVVYSDFFAKKFDSTDKAAFDDKKLLMGDGEDSLTVKDWEDYLKKMGMSQVWATTLEIRVLADMLKRPIVLLQFGAEPYIYNPDSTGGPIFIHHLNDNHFESCIPMKDHKSQDIYAGLKAELKKQRRD